MRGRFYRLSSGQSPWQITPGEARCVAGNDNRFEEPATACVQTASGGARRKAESRPLTSGKGALRGR